MNHRRTLGLRALAAMSLAVAFVAAGCSAGNGSGTGDAHGDGGARCDGSHCPLDGSVPDAGQSTDLLSIAIAPANPTLRVTAATPAPTQAFTLVGTQRDGRTRTVTVGVSWYLTDTSLGSVSTAGLFTSNGAGGTTTLRAGYGTLAPVTTTVTVLASTEIRGPGVTDALVAGFTLATLAGDNATSSPTVDYPLPAAVMPSNVFPPRVMWTARTAEAATDVVRVLLSRDHASVTYYALGSPLGWDIDPTAWGEFARSDIGLPITLTVSVLSGTTLRTSAPRTFKTISAVLGGSVYYWSPPAGALARIDVTTAAHVSFLPNPGDSCIGCHNVTRDGHRLMGFLNNVGNLIQFDLTRDLTATNPAPNLGSQPYSPRQCGTFSPDGSRYLMGDCGVDVALGTTGNAFRLVDTATMLPTSIAAGAAGTGFDPDWSPDGHHVAYTDVNNTVMVEPVTGPDAFGAPVPIRTGTNNAGEINWHPTWSPDNAWLAFQLGSLRRTGNGATGEIYLIAPTGGTAVHLANASAGADGTAYRPVFSPFNSGGDFWLLFASTRSYGTAAGGGVEGQKQIWVTAIHNHPDGVNDPSEAPYWLAGQEPNTALSPYWVPPPCRSNGTDCTNGNDCCSGQCGDPDSTGARACVPATNQCRMLGQTCTQDSDCCGGLVCNPMGHLCDVSLPG